MTTHRLQGNQMSEDPILMLLAEIKEDVAEIKHEVKRTNGRVTALELWRHGLAAIAESRSWVKPWVLGVASGVIVAAVTVGLTLAAAAAFT
jgi:dihydroxyacetone kinase